MKYTNLADSPEYYLDTIKLIEKAFNYSSSNSFAVDFAPLMAESNHHNCHIYIDTAENKVIAHVGVLNNNFKIKDKVFNTSMYGGIAVDEAYRGQSLFSSLFTAAIEENLDSTLHLLWSDKVEMYEKFGFYPAIEQYEHHQAEDSKSNYSKTKLSKLNAQQEKQLKELYKSSPELRFEREDSHWMALKAISSTNLYIKEEKNEIINYFFINKGEDLGGVIIEYGDIKDIKEINTHGILWSTVGSEEADVLYASVLKLGEHKLFSEFIHTYTEGMIAILSITDEEVEFDFEKSKFKLNHSEFLTGVFGPGRFEELSHLDPIYISGLDSI